MAELMERSLALATALVPEIGYDRAASVAKEAYANGESVREVAIRTSGLSVRRIAELLDQAGGR
jgi:fumarate hydratase class II